MKRNVVVLATIIFVLAGIPGARATEGLLKEISAQASRYPVVRAEFTQTKQMAAMKKPLVISGRFVYAQPQGVLWQIERPYRMTYVLAEEHIAEIGEDGVRRERSVRDVPGLAQVGRVVRAMLGANTAPLQEYFDLSAQGDSAKWSLRLTPRQAQIAQFLSSMQISGGRFIETVELAEAGGDSTRIQFRQSVAAETLTVDELRLFTGNGSGDRKP
jgi:hypothetical protein